MTRRLHLPGLGASAHLPLCARQLSKLTPLVQGQATMRLAATPEDEAKARAEGRICRHCLRTGAELPPVGAESPSGLTLDSDDKAEFEGDE